MSGRKLWWTAALLFILIGLFVWTAWLSDDAYITFRSISFLGADQGPNFNPGQRLQVFTHPLWFGLLAASFSLTQELYFTSLFLSIALSTMVVAGYVYLTSRRNSNRLLFGLSLLALSGAFLDYSTSGLENPLSHLVIITGLIGLEIIPENSGRERILFFAFMASSAALTRPDLILFFLPLLAYLVWRGEDKVAGLTYALIGLTPLGLWHGFSLWYYGFPFPNSAYAKLYTGLPRMDLIGQGLRYLVASAVHDPVTVLVIMMGIVTAVTSTDRTRRILALGAGAYLVYVVWIGGGFMRGRFLSTPFLLSACLIAGPSLQGFDGFRRFAWLAVIAVGLATTGPKLAAGGNYGSSYDPMGAWGVADERAAYYEYTGLIRTNRSLSPDLHEFAIRGSRVALNGDTVAVSGNLGLFGYYAGRTVHVLDRSGIADPLLARLEPVRTTDWRIGHMERHIPTGYLESLRSGTNQIEDPSLARYYEKLSVITQGPLASTSRMLEILKLNLGWYDHLIDRDEP